MKRWKKVLIWTLSVIVVLGVGGAFAANYAVDKLMNSMAGGFDVEAGNTPTVPQGQVVEPVVANSDPTAEPQLPLLRLQTLPQLVHLHPVMPLIRQLQAQTSR